MSVKRINSFTICNCIVKIFLFEIRFTEKFTFLLPNLVESQGYQGSERGEKEKGTKMQPNLDGSTIICHKILSVWVIWN